MLPLQCGYDTRDENDVGSLSDLFGESSSSSLSSQTGGEDLLWRYTLDGDDDDLDTFNHCSVSFDGTSESSRSRDASFLPSNFPTCRGATPSLLEVGDHDTCDYRLLDTPTTTAATATATVTTTRKMRRARDSPLDNPTPYLHAMSLQDLELPNQAQQNQHALQQAQHLLSPRSFTAAVLGPSAASHMPLLTSSSSGGGERRTVAMSNEGAAHLIGTSRDPSSPWQSSHGSSASSSTYPAWLSASLPNFTEGWTPSVLPPAATTHCQQAGVYTHTSSSSSLNELRAAEWAPLSQLREAATMWAEQDATMSSNQGLPPQQGEAHSPASSDASSTATVTPRTFAQQQQDTSSSSTATSSSPPRRHQLSLPLRLPAPAITILSDPYADLSRHLMRHGLRSEADTLGGMPPDFVLHNYLTIKGGPAALLGESEAFVRRHGREVTRQLRAAEVAAEGLDGEEGGGKKRKKAGSANDSLPESIVLDTQVLHGEALRSGMLPTHLLVVLSSMPDGTSGKARSSTGQQQQSPTTPASSPLTIPIHSLLYVLQCVSIPPLPISTAAATPTPITSSSGSPSTSQAHTAAALSEARELPIVALRVPRPDIFHLTHRFVYSHDPSALLTELAPLERLAAILRERELRKRGATKGKQKSTASAPVASHSESVNAGTTSASTSSEQQQQQVIMIPKPTKAECQSLLAQHLSQGELLEHAQRVHGAWANGVGLGLTTNVYWRTLERAWDLVVGALMLQQEMRQQQQPGHGQGQKRGASGREGVGSAAAAAGKGKENPSSRRRSGKGRQGMTSLTSSSSSSSSASQPTSHQGQRSGALSQPLVCPSSFPSASPSDDSSVASRRQWPARE